MYNQLFKYQFPNNYQSSKMKKYIIILLCLSSLNMFALSKIDSLKIKFEETSGLQKFKYSNKLAFAYLNINPDSTIYYATKSMKALAKSDSTFDLINSYLSLFEANLIFNNLELVDKYSAKIINIAKASKNPSKNLYYAYMFIGDIFETRSRDKESVKYYLEGYNLAIEENNTKEHAAFALYLGGVYSAIENFEQSLIYHIEALKLYEQLDNEEQIIASYNGLGNLYIGLEAFDRANEYYLKVYKKYKENNDDEGIAVVTFNMGSIYLEQKKYDEAYQYFKIAYDIDKVSGTKKFLAMDMTNIGEVLKGQKKYAEALDYYNQALDLYKSIKDEISTITPLLSIAEMYKQKNELGTAEKFCNEAKEIADKYSRSELDKAFAEFYSDLYFKTGNYKKSAENYKIYSALSDSLYNKDLLTSMSNIHSMYEVEKREKEIELLTNKNVIQEMKIKQNTANQILFIIVISFMFIAIIVLILWLKHRRKAHLLIMEQQKKLRQSLELLSAAQSELIAAEQKNTLLAMAVTANHEINQPLMVIKGNLDLFDMKLKKLNYDAYDKYIERINESIDNIKGILEKYRNLDHFKFTDYVNKDQMIKTFSSDEDE